MSKELAKVEEARTPAVVTEGPSWLANLGIGVSFVGLLGSVAWFGYFKQPAEMAVAVGACVFAMAFTRLDKFKLLKGAGVEVQLHEAREAAAVATATMKEVRTIALAQARVSLDVLARVGIWGAVSDVEKLRLARSVQEALIAAGSSDHEVADVAETLNKVTLFRHFGVLKDVAWKSVAHDRPKDVFKVQDELKVLADFGTLHLPPAAAVRKRLIRLRVFDYPKVQEAFLDFEHFATHGEFRRPEVWEANLLGDHDEDESE